MSARESNCGLRIKLRTPASAVARDDEAVLWQNPIALDHAIARNRLVHNPATVPSNSTLTRLPEHNLQVMSSTILQQL